MTHFFNPLPPSVPTKASQQSSHNYHILPSCGRGTGRPFSSSSGIFLRSSFLVERVLISPSAAAVQELRKPVGFLHSVRTRSAVGRRHHRRREDFDAYMKSKAKQQQQQALGKAQFLSSDNNNNRRGRGGRGDDKVVISLDMDELKYRAADAVVVAQRAAERSLDRAVRFARDAALESGEAWRELRSSVRVQRDRHVVISIRRSSLLFAAKALVGSVVLVLFARLFLAAVKEYRWGWAEGFSGSRVVRDRSLGGKEVTLNNNKSKGVKLWEGGPANRAVTQTPRAARGPLDVPVEDSRSEKELQRIARARGQGVPAVKKAARLPGWWPEADLPPSTLLSTRQRAEEDASRVVHGIMQKRLVGSEFSAEDILQLRQLCKAAGTKVRFDTYNTRDSFYRAAVNIVLSACQRAGKWSIADFGSEDGVRFIAGLAANVGLEGDRAATMVNAAVAARTRAALLQARALHMQSKRAESEEELLKLIRLHSCFPPDPDSGSRFSMEFDNPGGHHGQAEMEMVARGLGSHFDREGRVQMLQVYEELGGSETKRVAEEALGLLLTE